MSNEMKDFFKNSHSQRRVERRKGWDRRGKIGFALSAAGGVLWGSGLIFIYYGFPKLVTIVDLMFKKEPRTTFEPAFFFAALGLWAAGVILCLLSLFQFRKRYRRRADKRHVGIMVMLALNAVSFIGYGIFTLIQGF